MDFRPIATALTVAALALAGCGGDDESSSEPGGGGSTGEASAPSAGGPAKKAAKVGISDFKYDPEAIRVKAGGTVTWSNSDKAKHTAQTDDGAAGEFDTGDLEMGDSKKVTFDEAGKFTYYCIYHRFMEAKVEVVE
ncbi:MAG: plastocyanin/azurin family copper-binding protein [Actinomycetota bacterium]